MRRSSLFNQRNQSHSTSQPPGFGPVTPNPDDCRGLCEEECLASLYQHGLSSSHFGEQRETKILHQFWCLLDRLLASRLGILLSCDVDVCKGNHTSLKTSSRFSARSAMGRYTYSGVKTLLPRRPSVLMLLPPLTLQRSDCSTEVIHSSNSPSMFNSSSFKCFLVLRQCFNFHHPDADGCRTCPVEHFNDPQTLKSWASCVALIWITTAINSQGMYCGNAKSLRAKRAREDGGERELVKKKCKQVTMEMDNWVFGNKQGGQIKKEMNMYYRHRNTNVSLGHYTMTSNK